MAFSVGKALLGKGSLQKRVTIIPLNKIDSRTANNNQIAAADRASQGEAKLALSLVTCDAEVSAVMAYVFGRAFVCKDAATARAVAFDRDVRSTCASHQIHTLMTVHTSTTCHPLCAVTVHQHPFSLNRELHHRVSSTACHPLLLASVVFHTHRGIMSETLQ